MPVPETEAAEQGDMSASAEVEQKAEARGLGPTVPVVVAEKRRRRRKSGITFYLALSWLVIVLVCAVFSAVLPVKDPNAINVTGKLAGPMQEGYILGADGLGRDMLARLVHGARISVVIALSGVGIGLLVGGTLGMMAGFFRGKFEMIVVSIIDIILAFPGLVLLLALVAFMGRNLRVIALVIGLLSIPVYTRVARANTLSISQREFVLAARSLGAKSGRILFREILPNVILPVMAFGLIAMGVIIVIEGALALLGLSVEAPQATWGGMISEGKRHLHDTTHVALLPSLTMFLTVLSLNLVGDTLRSRFDVRESGL